MVLLQLLHTGPAPIGLLNQLLSELRFAGKLILVVLILFLCDLKLLAKPFKLLAKPFELLAMFLSLPHTLLSLTLVVKQILIR
ncbi:hypothetical protein ACOSQ3_016404 [Xanthoceras sorbifolium]